MSDTVPHLGGLTHGKYKPWMIAAALSIAVLIYMYTKHSAAGTVAPTVVAPTDPTAGANTSGGADSALGSPSEGTSTTYNNYYITETVPKPATTHKPAPKTGGTPHHAPPPHHVAPKPVHHTVKRHAEVMTSHPATHRHA